MWACWVCGFVGYVCYRQHSPWLCSASERPRGLAEITIYSLAEFAIPFILLYCCLICIDMAMKSKNSAFRFQRLFFLTCKLLTLAVMSYRSKADLLSVLHEYYRSSASIFLDFAR